MKPTKHILYIYTETPMHVGTGVGLGAVDMPIQREKHTGYPIIQASGVKGSLRDTVEVVLEKDEDTIKAIFGGASGDKGEDFAGAISPSDARILLFPVRALNGVFVWVTSPTVIARYIEETGIYAGVPEYDSVQVASEEILLGSSIMLEEFSYAAEYTDSSVWWASHFANQVYDENADNYWKNRMKTHFAILPDNEFRDFVRYSTEVVTRIQLASVTKTVTKGALFTQELLPADSLLYSVVHVTRSRHEKESDSIKADDVLKKLTKAVGERLQIGGDETVGRGRVRLNWKHPEEE